VDYLVKAADREESLRESAEKTLCKELRQVAAAMNNADKINSVLQRKIEEKNLLESTRHPKTAHPLEFCLSNKEETSASGLSSKQTQRCVGRGKKPVWYFDVAVSAYQTHWAMRSRFAASRFRTRAIRQISGFCVPRIV
jgi:hypothetical protein